MDDERRKRVQLDCLYGMFRDRVEENVIYIVYSENEGKIDTTIDQLMSIAACSFTGYQFDSKPLVTTPSFNGVGPRNSFGCETRASRSSDANQVPSTSSVRSPLDKNRSNDKIELNHTDEAIDETSLSIGERIERLQKSINDLLEEKKSSHDKACQYLSRKMYPVTGYYSELSNQLRRMIEDKTNKLVELLLQKSKNSDHIDLHGLNPVQARLVVSELLKIRQRNLMIDKQGEASIDIITGWGKHSVNQGHRIRPTIVALLREMGLQYHRLNKGALRVTIRR